MNLGEQLKANQAKALEAKRQRTLEEKAAYDEATFVLLMQTRFFFDYAFRLFEHQLLNGKVPAPIALGGKSFQDLARLLDTHRWAIPCGQSRDWRTEGKGIWSPMNPLHFVWVEFERRCNDAGLAPQWSSEHDGVGIESWYVLTVTAA